MQRGLVLAILASLLLVVLWLFTEEALLAFEQDPALCGPAGTYALARIPGAPFVLFFVVFRSWLQGRRIMKPTMWAVLFANIANVLGNWLLIFGELGFPELGILGAGIASSITQACMLLGLLYLVKTKRLSRGGWLGWSRETWCLKELRSILRVGLPIGAQLGLEIWAFQIATLWAGLLGATQVASHTIALTLASVSFMVPLGISIGAGTRVGNLIGARKFKEAQRAGNVALGMGTASMVVFALLFILLRNQLPLIFSRDPEVVLLCASVLPIAAAFQLFDGSQVVAGGVLRAMGRTRPTAVGHLLAFYGFGLPLAYWLSVRGDWGLKGIWWGLALALALVSLGLGFWVARFGPATLGREEADSL